MILKKHIVEAQRAWSDGLLRIVHKHQNNQDYTSETNIFLDKLYAYDLGEVLFKPTLASHIQFRLTREAAISYFIGGNNNFLEDSGFALKGWQDIVWENSAIKIEGNIAMAMGNYYFLNGQEKLKVEFSFVYKRTTNGTLKIILHDSHLPYQK